MVDTIVLDKNWISKSVFNIPALKSMSVTGYLDGTLIHVLSTTPYSGGTFVWISADATTPDDLNYVRPTGLSVGNWKRITIDTFLITATGKIDPLILPWANPLQFKGEISLPANFPTLAEVQDGWLYYISNAVTDNDPTKTNTGQSFTQYEVITWKSGSPNKWINVSGNDLWLDTGTVVKLITPRQLDMQSQKILNLANGVASTDAVNKGQLDAKTPSLIWDGANTFESFYLENNISGLFNPVTVTLKGTGHMINNTGVAYSNLQYVTFDSPGINKVIHIADQTTFTQLPNLGRNVSLISDSTNFVVVDPSNTSHEMYIGPSSYLSSNSSISNSKMVSFITIPFAFNLDNGSIAGADKQTISSTGRSIAFFINNNLKTATLDPTCIYGDASSSFAFFATTEYVFPAPGAFTHVTGTIANNYQSFVNGTTAVTQAAGDNSTKIATTAYVDAAVGIENLWDRTGTNLTTHTSGDTVQVGNLKLDTNTLTSVVTNGYVYLTPNGTGKVEINTTRADTVTDRYVGQFRGDLYMDGGNLSYNKLKIMGGNQFGYLYGNYPLLDDGVHFGYNYSPAWNGTAWVHERGTDAAGTSRISAGYGYVSLCTGAAGANPTSAVYIDSLHNVTINNILFNTNTISAANTNGNIILTPNGTGAVKISTLTTNGILQTTSADGTIVSSAALANGTTATTQSAGDNSTKVATTAYVDTAVGVENLWDRTGTNLTTHTSGDTVQVGNLKLDTNTISATNTNGNIAINPAGSGALLTGNLSLAGTDISSTANLRLLPVSGSEVIVYGPFPVLNLQYSDWASSIINLKIGSSTIRRPAASDDIVYWSGAYNVGGSHVFKIGPESGTNYTVMTASTSSIAFNLFNLSVTANTISATNTNGNIVLTPNGTGKIQSASLALAGGYVTTDASGNLTATTIPTLPTQYWSRASTTLSPATSGDSLAIGNLKLDTSTISSTNTNGDINISPNGAGLIKAGRTCSWRNTVTAAVGGTDLAVDNSGSTYRVWDTSLTALFNLPSATNTGVNYRFFIAINTAAVMIQTAGTDKIVYGTTETTAGGYVDCNVVGSVIEIECTYSGIWTVMNIINPGQWGFH